MYAKFLILDAEKQTRILNAALKEFAQNGYKKAATDEIVKNAGIGKGMLFHYFQNKKGLFSYLCEYSFEILKTELLDRIDLNSRDLLARYREIARAKLQLYVKHPYLLDFLSTLAVMEDEAVKDILNPFKQSGFYDIFGAVCQDVDTTKFKESLDPQRAIQLILWSVSGFDRQAQREIEGSTITEETFEKHLADFYAYLDVLEKCFYRRVL